MNNKKRITLPCTDEEYILIKMYCAKYNVKHDEITKLIIKSIKEKEDK